MTPHFWIKNTGGQSNKLSVYYGPVLLSFRVTDEIPKTTEFDIDELCSLTLTDGDGIVNFCVNDKSGKNVTLTDYYTAGKTGGKFASWLNCTSGVPLLPSDRNGIPIWCNRK